MLAGIRSRLKRLFRRSAHRQTVANSVCLAVTSFDELAASPDSAARLTRAIGERLVGSVCHFSARKRPATVTLQFYAEMVERPDQLILEKQDNG